MRSKLAAVAVATVLAAGFGVTTAGSASAETSDCGVYSWSQAELSYGDSGDEVKALQCELNASSTLFSTPFNLGVDGQFGDQTLAAVKKFQGCAKLQADGIVGPKTWNALDFWATPWNTLTC
ncbi:zinc D-Ala-D-Ala carboxypeptidase [Kitasatospora sp. MAA19]|uniref:peptidoglycan-binding domain-containing protein n=1 Tax=unclassified Kitasatospora TaxID=2633591 RepID=UPI0024747EC0|nr:peptidoglycan-binding domain-containing protein [Kitasatospora sp. MAA19]MDH6707387.1 zinc D-Ala-D-Ala carboxypeptidase [Kitasatospora sp. MAA19]